AAASKSARASAQTLTFKVPLAYHIGSCTQHLKRITVSLVAPDGLLSMSEHHVMRPMPGSNGALRAPDDEVMVRRLCGTAFHIVPGSTRHLLRKAIDCLAADTQWQPQERTSTGRGSDINVALDQLKHTDLRLIYRLSEAQWPLYPSHWMPVENGMKPCASPWKGIGESTCGYGQQTFSTFEMEGRQCSVYPGCT
ncbi:hypothetical protein G3435_11635, partial [Pseudomonas sp. MAFF212428]|nr:hypothetical protein [Pseudomonas brassicae]